MSRPSKSVCALAKQFAGQMPKRDGLFARSSKNRRILDAAMLMDARQRYLRDQDFPPERETRQQRRRARMRGPNGT